METETDKTNEVGELLLSEVNKYYPELKTATQVAEVAAHYGYIWKSTYGHTWKAYCKQEHQFIGAAQTQGDAWAKVLLYSIDNKH